MTKSNQLPGWVRGIAILIYILSAGVYPWLVLGKYGNLIEGPARRIFILILLAIAGSWIIFALYRKKTWGIAFIFTVLFYGAVYQLCSFIPDLSTYPLSLGWSEVSRYYYASLFFAEQIYGVDAPPSVLHPTRYLMQAVPFLLENVPLWVHRFWQVVLWVIFTFFSAHLLIQRINRLPVIGERPPEVKGSTFKLAFIMWAFLFTFQGPVYYHLMVMVILILWGFDRRNFWKTMMFVLLASLWAGISRVNWFPVPGLLASVLFLLEVPIQGRSIWRYLWGPLIWTFSGVVAALIARQVYIFWSGNSPDLFGSSFSSDLLWYRLFPNPTYPLGILPSIALVSLPLLGAITLQLYWRWSRYHTIRMLGISAILIVLFFGGVIVSLKIGGGSNLHNLDAYLVLLLVIGSFISLGSFPEDRPHETSMVPILSNKVLIAAVVAVPVFFAISSGGQLPTHNIKEANEAIQTIRDAIRDMNADDGDVLFISQRHLLTFSDIQDVQLVPEYEKVFLMEMAMSNNRTYLNEFYIDLEDQRFKLIITDTLKIQYQGRSHGFGEENDAWVSNVSEPVLCYYEPLKTLSELETQILVPRNQPCN